MSTGDHTLAHSVVNDMLLETACALMAGDFDAFAHFIHVPFVLETLEGVVQAETLDILRELFENARKFYLDNAIVELDRSTTQAEFVSPEKIFCVYQNRLVKDDGTSERAPYHVFASLELHDEVWKVAHSQYVITDSPEHNRSLLNRSDK